MRTLRMAMLAALALAWGAGCADHSELPLAPPDAPRFEIVDGMRGGNAHFFFLPPLVPQPGYLGSFDAALSPVVEICAWTGTGCATPPVARFTTTTGPGSETVRLEDEHYLVNWHTDAFVLDPEQPYRIVVSVAGTPLGHADVALAESGRDLKNVDTGEYLALLDGRTLPIKFRIEEGAVFVVGSEGGTVTAADGRVELVVPAGALDAEAGIVVAPVPDASLPPGLGLIPGAVFDFRPNGLVFAVPAMLTIAYAEANVPAGVPETALTLLAEDAGVWDEAAGTTVDEVANRITGPIEGFSRKGGAAAAVVTVSPTSATLGLGETVQLVATVTDAVGNPLTRPLRWSSSDDAIATVDASGLVAAVAPGMATVTVRAGSAEAEALVAVTGPGATSTGHLFTCALVEGQAYCWGNNSYGQLGDGTYTTRLTPVPVSGGLTFQSIMTGPWHACGVTVAGDAYCWGRGDSGQLGDGTITWRRPTPGLVSGGLTFKSIARDGGGRHACALTPAGDAYCWGWNYYGQLGDGTTTSRLTPTLVSGDHSFQKLSSGHYHVCGVTQDGEGYCWGTNIYSQLGDGTTVNRLVPTPISGGHTFELVSLGQGGMHSCGITSTGETYCWGRNDHGQVGDGSTTQRSVPVPVAGNLDFRTLGIGMDHTCGATATGETYCWGWNMNGQLGDGSTVDRLTPAPVIGGLSFWSMTGGNYHTCGVTLGGDGYCWGRNDYGQVGDGSTVQRLAPVFVIDLTPSG